LVQTLDLSAGPKPRKRPHEFGPVHAIWFVPALAIAAVLSIPISMVAMALQKKREQSFKDQMRAARRVIAQRDFEQVLQEGRGTVIVERYSLKGPIRWWWTSENLYDICPYPLVTWFEKMPDDECYRPLAEWCQREYTSSEQGRALLVDLASRRGEGKTDRNALCSGRLKWFEVAPTEKLRPYREQ
jgi:hypothetical protein